VKEGAGERKPVVVITYAVTGSPEVEVTSPAANATYLVGEALTAKYECTENVAAGSKLKPGAAGCSATLEGVGALAKGATVPTTRVGRFTLKVSATSEDGLTSTKLVHYTVAAKPTVSAAGVVPGKIYAVDTLVRTSFECIEGAYGSGLEACLDSYGEGKTYGSQLGVTRISGTDKLDTAAAGEYTYEVDALSHDGAEVVKDVKYVVAAPPEAEIKSPGSGGIYARGQFVPTSFHCKDGEYGNGIYTCTDSNGSSNGIGALRTTEAGEHTYTVTARSKDGQFTSTSIHYRVALAPRAVITFPRSGGVYNVGETVDTSYYCEESPFGPGLESCQGEAAGGVHTFPGSGTLSTGSEGSYTYTVSAISSDSQLGATSITYRVR
jgi:hypothetical protein